MRRRLVLAWLLAAACAGRGGGAEDGRTSIRFVIEAGEGTTAPVWIALHHSGGGVGWVQVTLEGARVHLQERCDVEDCGVPPAVCGMAVPMVRNLTAGGERRAEFVWDGLTSVVDSTARCETRRPAPPGTYVARFCYAREAQLQGGDPARGAQGVMVSPECVERSFTLTSREVVVRL